MAKFLVYHTLPTDLTFDQLEQMAEGAHADPNVKAYRAFLNLSKGKGVCAWEGPNSQGVAARLRELEIPFDDIIAIEAEGDGVTVQKVETSASHA